MISNYSYNIRKKKPPFFKILIVILLIINGLGFTMIQRKNFKASAENHKLKAEIGNIKVETEKLLTENNRLDNTIREKEQQYKDATRNLKIAYLTFDDGPSENTDEILAILDRYGIKATFFVIANDKYKDKYPSILEKGHKIALHSYSHDYEEIYKSVDSFKDDINKLKVYINNITGSTPENILRYPGGSTNTTSHKYGGVDIMKSIIEAMRSDHYVYYDWNVDSFDASANRVSKNKIVQSVLGQAHNKKKPVVLLHDTNSKDTTVQALPEIIEGLSSQGFTFDMLSVDTPLK